MTASSPPDRLVWYRRMLLIRRFEEKVQELFMGGHIQSTSHLCQGQEAVSVGSIAAMRRDDVLTNTYRGHRQALARGMAPETAFAELMGRRAGGSGGVGGSMHLVDFSMGNIGSNAIVGAGLPIAVGQAFRTAPRAVSMAADLLVPYSPPLEDEIIPSADAIADAARAAVHG